MLVRVTDIKAAAIRDQCLTASRKAHISIRELSSLIGGLVACEPGVLYAQIFYKRLEIAKNAALKTNFGYYDADLKITQEMREDIIWWADNIDKASKPIYLGQPDISLCSDASKKGWGGVCGEIRTGGQWSQHEKGEHINLLELTAAFFAIRSFCKDKNNVHIQIEVDNTTAMACINKKCSNVSHLNEVSRQLWLWCMERNNFVSALHLPGTLNTEADHESRVFNVDTEWMLFPEIFEKLVNTFGPVEIDLFASRINNQVDTYVSWRPDPNAVAVDAFYVNWQSYNHAYIFPPFSLMGAVLKKVEEQRATVLLVAPIWITQPWFTKLLQLLIAEPLILPQRCLLLPQDPDLQHPLKKLRLIGCLLSGDRYRTEAFRRPLPPSYCNPGGSPLRSSMGLISRNGCHFAIKGKLILCNHV